MSQEPQPHSTLAAPAARLTDWANEPDVRVLKMDVEAGQPAQKTHLLRVEGWLDQLNLTGKAKVVARKNRSQVQPKLVRKQAEWRYSALSEPFLSADRMFTVSPTTWEDKDAAEQNALVLNWQFNTKIDTQLFIDQYVRTCVDEGTVVVKLGWCLETEDEEVQAPVYAYFPAVGKQAEAVQEALDMVAGNPAALEQMSPDIQESVKYSQEKQAPHVARAVGTQAVKRQKVLKNCPTVEVADIRNLVIDPTCGADPDKAMFMAYTSEVTWASLEKDGRYKNLDAVNWNSTSILATPDHTPQGIGGGEANFRDKARQKNVLTEYYGVWDITGTGKLEPVLIAWIGDVVVRAERSPFPDGKPPFVIVPMMPIKKSPYGEPDAELTADNQAIIGALTRGLIDLMARSANSQRGMAKNMLDAPNRKKFENGDDYEFNPNAHPANSIFEHKFPEIPQSALQMIQMMSMDAESLTGVQTFGEGITGASLGPTAAGVKSALSSAALRQMGILRRLANGLAKIGSKIIAMNQEYLSEEETIRVTNEHFIQVRRDDIQGRFDMKCELATAEENEARASRLEFMLQTMGNTGDPQITKMILIEIAQLRRMPALAHQLKVYEPKPDPLQQQKLQLEVKELESKIRLLDAQAVEVEARAGLNDAKAQEALSNKDRTDLDYVEQETGTHHAREMQKAEAQADANARLEITKGILNQKNPGSGPDGKPDTSPTKGDIEEAAGFNAR